MILVNILKHCFTELWIEEVIHAYKSDKLTFISPIPVTADKKTSLVVLNDDNVNRMFGWAIWKVKKIHEIDRSMVT